MTTILSSREFLENDSVITPRLCRSRYQFAQQMSNEAARLSAEIKNELTFTFIDTSSALPDSAPDSSEFSCDSEDEVRAGIERKRIW